ncbi:MAG: AAA family ATPase [Candidatus Magasanikbacteria bacterium]|nr:AAA family ATPase [Candidatus Magasanikbacteria bacterium]
MTNNKIILGFTGFIASGKGTAAEYLKEKYNAPSYRFSTMLRDILDRIYVEKNRDNLIKTSEFIRSTFGEDVMAKTLGKDVENDSSNTIVVDGIRRMADIEYLTKMSGFVLIHIDANPKIRYERLVKRSENTDDQSKTYEDFLADHERSTEISIREVAKQAMEKIENSGNFEELNKQIDNIIKKYGGQN